MAADMMPTLNDYSIQEVTNNSELQRIGWTIWFAIWHGDDSPHLEEIYQEFGVALNRLRQETLR